MSDPPIDHIRYLLAQGHSERTVAARVGCSKTLVHLVKTGEYKREKRYCEEVLDTPDRCDKCRQRISVRPCRLCKVRER